MSPLTGYHLCVCVVLAAVALHVWLNRRKLPRLEGVAPAHQALSVSVLIPARNEAARIERCVRSWVRQTYEAYEVLVYDDASVDDTAARAVAAAAGAAHMRVICGDQLPEGWRGKPHACARLRAAAHGELLVFADADIEAAPGTVAATVATCARLQVGVVSAVPLHVSRSAALRGLAAVQNWAVLAFLPAWLTGGSRRAVAALNGQFIAIDAAVYDTVGGFAAVRLALAEDVALARRLAAHGFSAPLLDGSRLLRCDPYTDLAQLWAANVRNLLPIFFGSATVLLLAMTGLAALYLGPIGLLAVGLATGPVGLQWVWLPLGEMALGFVGRRIADARFGYPVWVTLMHPCAAAALVGMAVDSVLRHRLRHVIEWRGRRYAVHNEAA